MTSTPPSRTLAPNQCTTSGYGWTEHTHNTDLRHFRRLAWCVPRWQRHWLCQWFRLVKRPPQPGSSAETEIISHPPAARLGIKTGDTYLYIHSTRGTASIAQTTASTRLRYILEWTEPITMNMICVRFTWGDNPAFELIHTPPCSKYIWFAITSLGEWHQNWQTYIHA